MSINSNDDDDDNKRKDTVGINGPHLQSVKNYMSADESLWRSIPKIGFEAIPMSLTFTWSIALVVFYYMSSNISEGDQDKVASASYFNSLAFIINALAYSGSSGMWTALSAIVPESNKSPEENEIVIAHKKSVVLRQSFILGIFNTALSQLIIYQCENLLVNVFGQSPAIAKSVAANLKFYGLASLCIMIKTNLEPLLFGGAQRKRTKWIAGIGSPVILIASMALSYGLGYAKKDPFKLSIGLYAEAFASMLFFIILAIIDPRFKNITPFKNFSTWKTEFEFLLFLLKKQAINLLQSTSENASAFCFSTELTKVFGGNAITAYSAVNLPNSFLLYLLMAASYKVSSKVTEAFNKENSHLKTLDFSLVRKHAKAGLLFNLIVSLVGNGIFAYKAKSLAEISLRTTLSDTLANKVFIYAIAYSVANIFDSLRFCANQIMLGLRNSKANTLISVLTPLLCLSLAYGLSRMDSLNDYGAVIGWNMGIVLSTMMTLSLMLYNLRDTNLEATLKRSERKKTETSGCFRFFRKTDEEHDLLLKSSSDAVNAGL